MQKDTHIVGIDPGIVHTGVVSMEFFVASRKMQASHVAIPGPDADAVQGWITSQRGPDKPHVYIEGYRSRGGRSSHDKDMLLAVDSIRKATGGKVLDNMGIKTTVKRPVLELLGVWKFSTPTHHDDLRSAARIAVLGMLKHHNELLADVVRDHLDGRPWRVV